jgi:thiamine kinase-like enzyme
MKKAVNLTDKFRGDDGYNNRLLSYLNNSLLTELDEITCIKEQVYLAEASDFHFVLKGFSSLRRLKIQEAFTDSLKKEGFQNTYSFYSLSKEPVLFFQSKYFGCLEYIKKANDPFYFDTRENCREGLQLLQQFHETTEKLEGSYRTLLPSFHLIEKWQERFASFKRNLPFLSFFLPKEIITELFTWVEWSLAGLRQEKELLGSLPKVILHGDVAHHNFIRNSEGELFLIDFDLITIGPEVADYVQYANRILPFLNWSVEDLATFERFQLLLQQKVFLYALAFPSDILREWNRLVKEHTYNQTKKVRPVMELTFGQFEKRKSFFKELVSIVK